MIGPTAALALAMRDAGIEDADGKAASVLDALTRNNWRVVEPPPLNPYVETDDDGNVYARGCSASVAGDFCQWMEGHYGGHSI